MQVGPGGLWACAAACSAGPALQGEPPARGRVRLESVVPPPQRHMCTALLAHGCPPAWSALAWPGCRDKRGRDGGAGRAAGQSGVPVRHRRPCGRCGRAAPCAACAASRRPPCCGRPSVLCALGWVYSAGSARLPYSVHAMPHWPTRWSAACCHASAPGLTRAGCPCPPPALRSGGGVQSSRGQDCGGGAQNGPLLLADQVGAC